MTEEQKIMQGTLFCPRNPDLRAKKLRTHNLNLDYNATYEDETEKRQEILHQILSEVGDGCFMQGPIFFHYGSHTKIGARFFANFNLNIQDDAPVTIGDDCNFGPNVTIVTPLHPMLAEERRHVMDEQGEETRVCYAKPVSVGNDCWFGAGVIVCPGVTIGNGCVIGAGSVVTRDIPDNCFAAGNPCRVIRQLTEADSLKNMPEILGSYQLY